MAVKGLLGLAKAAKNYGNTPLPNAPMPANVPGAGLVNIGPNPAAEQAAIQYSQSSGIPYTPVTSFMPADPQFGARVAREYELMPHDPTNRRVQQSYGALADEIAGQYEAMLRAGIKPEFNQNPYPQSPYLGLMDMLETGRLQVYPTRAGFGMDDAFDSSQNLLLAESPFKISGQPATFNDLFRAVHDFQGHAKVGAGFRGAGEEMAYLSHAGTMSPDALKALASETRGQNSWLNYGPFGDANRTAGIDDTIFAKQKSGLLPNWAIQERLPELDVRRQRFNELRAKYDTGLEGAIDDSGNLTLVHYSSKPIERVDPNFYGKGLSGRTREELNRSYSEDFVPRSYYGIEADVNPYVKELGLGANKVETQIDAAQIYDVKKDPEGLWKDGKGDVTKSEKNLWDKGYSGYFVDNQRLGKVAAIFDPLDVTKKLMVPLVPTAAAGLTALAPQEAEAGAAGLLSGGLGTEQAQAAEYNAAPVVQEQSFGDMVNEYAQINQRAQAAEAQKFDTLMREDARLRAMGSAAFGQVSPELAAYRRSQILPTIGEIGMGALEGAVDTVDFVSQLPTAISTMTMPKRTPLRDRLSGLLDYSFVDERDQRARDEARLIGGLLSPI
jgi:hypothetical protein